MIAIVDYGLGNLFNVQRAFEHIGASTIVTDNHVEIQSAESIVLPGVGAFGEGMVQLRNRRLDEVVVGEARKGKPLLGICLGMQLLMDSSEELGMNEGLHLIPGTVKYLNTECATEKLKVPHMGWSGLVPAIGDASSWKGSILADLPKDELMYFVHSLFVTPERFEDALAFTNYGPNKFCSVLQRGNIAGCQFHPERSAESGIAILRNFLALR